MTALKDLLLSSSSRTPALLSMMCKISERYCSLASIRSQTSAQNQLASPILGHEEPSRLFCEPGCLLTYPIVALPRPSIDGVTNLATVEDLHSPTLCLADMACSSPMNHETSRVDRTTASPSYDHQPTNHHYSKTKDPGMSKDLWMVD